METQTGDTKMDLTAYNTAELKNVTDLDAYAVRAEAERRAAKATKAIAKAQAAMRKAEAELAECAAAISAAYVAIAA
jgi:hypothetical protein